MKASGRPTISRRVSYRWSDIDPEQAVVTDIQQLDVLCCEKINNPKSDGNRRFAALLAMSCREYVATKSISERKNIVGSVVNSFILHSRAPGGRFLKSTPVSNEYIVISRREAVEWVYKELQQVLRGDTGIPSPSLEQQEMHIPTQNITPSPPCEQHTVIEEECGSLKLPMHGEAVEVDKTVSNVLKGQKKILSQMSAQGKFKIDITKKIPTSLLPWSSTSFNDVDSSEEPVKEMQRQETDSVPTRTLSPVQDDFMMEEVPKNALEDRVSKILQNQKNILTKMSDQGKFREATMKLIESELSSSQKVEVAI